MEFNMQHFKVNPYVPMTKAGVLGFLNENKKVSHKKTIETMQEKLDRGRTMPEMKELFGSYFHQGELTILAGQSNVGKSLLAFQIADGISKGEDILEQRNECEPQKVIYYDFEMSERNLIKRYPNYNANDNFLTVKIDDLLKEHDGVFDLDVINQHIKEEKASVVIIDNISAIAMKSLQDQNESLRLIKAAKQLVSGGNLSILLLAHTPKIYGVKPIELKDIAGSANIGNLCDSAFFICKSREGAGRRYIKQVKSRNAEMIEQCLIADIKQLDYLKLDFVALDDERNHLKIEEDRTNAKRNEFINLAEEVFSNAESLTRKEIIDRISDLKKLSENGARHRFDKLIENELITKRDGKYILNT